MDGFYECHWDVREFVGLFTLQLTQGKQIPLHNI